MDYAGRSVDRVLAQGQPSVDELAETQRLWEDEERFPRLVIACRGERTYMHEAMAAVERGDVPLWKFEDPLSGPPSRPLLYNPLRDTWDIDELRERHTAMLPLLTEGVQVAALPAHERAKPMAKLAVKWMRHPAQLQGAYPFLSFNDVVTGLQGQMRCLIVALAAERYRRQHGQWPDDLDKLVPEFLAAVPLDPQDGKPLKFRHLNDGIVVYSRFEKPGPGGTSTYDPDEPSPHGTGVALRLFDVGKRRQPPMPRPVPGDIDSK